MSMPGSTLDRLRQSQRLALASCLLLAALALWLALRIGLALWPRSAPGELVAPPAGNVPVAVAPASLARFHLFGVTPLQPGSAAPGAPSPVTGLILRGTLADRDPNAGVAVIDGAGDGERAFRVGDEVLPGVVLAAIHADHVVLSRGGAEETLRLTRDTNPDPGNIVRPAPGMAKGSRTVTGAPASAAPVANIPAAPARADGELQATLARLRANPEELLRRMQVVPVLDGGRLAGVRVSASGADATLLAQAGLQSGDVVTAVNGQRVDSLERGQQIVAGLASATSVRLTVLRNGKSTDVTVGSK